MVMRREPTVTHPANLMAELIPMDGDQDVDEWEDGDFQEDPEIDIYGWDLITVSIMLNDPLPRPRILRAHFGRPF